ncbi:MAG: aconitate hydratase [Pyrinomonas sp.]|uniref:aconitate hydratase n=1 Tax=Pyrinomonas sp. TaxID=2080306 RepID=UPI003332913A
MTHNLFNSLQDFPTGRGRVGKFYSLPQLEREGLGQIGRLPVSIRIVLESLLRNCDGRRIRKDDVRKLARWQPTGERTDEIPFVVARVLLQDFTGVPLLVDLAAMRSAVARMGRDPKIIEPLVPVDLVVDNSVQVDFARVPDALRRNMEMEFRRNRSRYQFLKWGQQAFSGFRVIPPGIGICHQVNLEYLAKGVIERDGVYFPDTLVGTDSHTTMVNGLGVVGWGVGGIEAEAAMLGQPVYFLTPDVVGVHMTGRLRPGVTATDLVLRVTEMLRQAKVVGKFVEFFGEGAASLNVPDRATIANMAPEYGATMGFFPVDEKSCEYLLATGRSEEHVETFRNYFKAQGLFGIPRAGEVDYTTVLELDLATIQPSVAGPRRPQDRIELAQLKERFVELLRKPMTEGGYGKSEIDERVPVHKPAPVSEQTPLAGGGQQEPETVPVAVHDTISEKNTNVLTEVEMINNRPTPDRIEELPPGELPPDSFDLGHGDVVIAAITSCTNTSNPSVMLAAGLLAKKAVERGLRVPPFVKTSLAPGSRVVTEYLKRSGLQDYLDRLGFNLVGYGCTTCIGNSGPLDVHIEEAINARDLVVASVLSGNRNFEARVHQSVRANFLASPPLVVAFALAGTVRINLETEPIGTDGDGRPVYLHDIWPSLEEIDQLMRLAFDPETYRRLYSDFVEENPLWNEIPSSTGDVYDWDPQSTYIQEPPYFEKFSMDPGPLCDIKGARPLAIFGDSVTTDHISPAGAIKPTSPAGVYLQLRGVKPEDFNSYGARRGNHQVMVRGTFANVRIKNLMVPGTEGGVTVLQPVGQRMSIYDAAVHYQAAGVPLVVIAGQEYGTGSSRDWAAKGTRLLGVRAVIAQSFERIHRSNLVGMGVLPCQFKEGMNAQTLGLDGTEVFDLIGIEDGIMPREEITLVIHRADGRVDEVPVILRIDTPIEVDFYRHGGILPYVLRQLLQAQSSGEVKTE